MRRFLIVAIEFSTWRSARIGGASVPSGRRGIVRRREAEGGIASRSEIKNP